MIATNIQQRDVWCGDAIVAEIYLVLAYLQESPWLDMLSTGRTHSNVNIIIL